MPFDVPGKHTYVELWRMSSSPKMYASLSSEEQELLSIALEFGGRLDNRQIRELQRIRINSAPIPIYCV